MDAETALSRLKKGNDRYVKAEGYGGDVSSGIRLHTAENGQHPYAAVVNDITAKYNYTLNDQPAVVKLGRAV